MIEESLNNELLKETSVDNIDNKDETTVIETLSDDVSFTPVVSDGIYAEEILDLNDNEVETLNEVNDSQFNADSDELLMEDNVEVIESPINNEVYDNDDSTLIHIDKTNEEVDFTNLDKVELEDKEVINNVVEKNDNVENDFSNLEIDTNEDLVANEKDIPLENENKVVENSNDTLLEKYGENFSVKEYVCNPAIGRDNEIKQLILTLLTPEKSGILVGKPGIGKTAIVEGLGYQIQKGNVPDALKEYQIYKLNTSSLLGVMPGTNEPKIQVLLNEIKGSQKLILFIDEIHTLIGTGAEGDSSLDFANIFKPGLDRGNIKIIGATTSDEYDRYILTDKAFVRRFQKIDVLEPTKEHTVKIMMGSLPKLEHKTGAKLKYTPFIQEKIMTFIVDLTTEYRRVYELSARYPDVALTILQQAFSYAVFDNKKEVSIRDVRKAICNTKLVYQDVIKKELVRFNEVFSDIYLMETPQRLKGETSI